MRPRSQILQSRKVLELRRKKRIVKYTLISIAGASIIAAFFLFVNLSFFQITKVTLTGVETLDPIALEASAQGSIEGRYLGMFAKKSTFFVSKSKVEDTLLENFKKIERVEASRDGISGLEVEVVERKPAVLVCMGFHEVDTEEADETCYFADEKGYVFAPAPEFSGGVYMRYYVPEDEATDPVGKNFIELDTFQELQAFADSISSKGISVRGMLLAEDGMYELYVKNIDQSEAIIYFDDKSPFERTASNLVAFWDNAQKAKTSASIFEYINLRFGNNIFYVLK